jgi:hypothetical protein
MLTVIFCIYLFCFLEIGSLYTAQEGPELSMYPKLASNSQSSYLSLPSVWITGLYHHTWLFLLRDMVSHTSAQDCWK